MDSHGPPLKDVPPDGAGHRVEIIGTATRRPGRGRLGPQEGFPAALPNPVAGFPGRC